MSQSKQKEPASKASKGFGKNILKVRDNPHPVIFERTQDDKFTLCEGYDKSDGPEGKQDFGYSELRRHIEPWLTALFQSEHLSLLLGSGLTSAVHSLATGDKATGMGEAKFPSHQTIIDHAADIAAKRAGRGSSNLEDQLRAANELLRGLEILQNQNDADSLRTEIDSALENFSSSILKDEANIVLSENKKLIIVFNTLVTFMMSFASRSGTRDRLNIFTTNYDRLIETGAEIAGMHLLDRFVGQMMPVFRSSRLDLDMHYNPPGIRGEPRYLEGVARFTKLHGSLDWVQVGKEIRRIGLPFGASSITPYLDVPGLTGSNIRELMVFPNSAKDRETADYPYVELFRDFAAAICRPNSTLVTYGYGFGDDHINRSIRDMLTIPSTHLVVIARSDTYGRIMEIYEERSSQVSLLIGQELASLKPLTEILLPKAAIDKATLRMGELLKKRFGTHTEEQPQKNNAGDDGNAGGNL